MKTSNKLLKLTAEIVSAHVTNNTVDHADIPEIISSTFSALKKVFDASVSLESEALKQKATVRISDSVFPDYIICLEDGKKLKMLKRHLRSVYNLSIDEYKKKWGLPHDYPVVAPNYAIKRSRLAKAIGLGSSAYKQQFSDKASK